MVRTPVPPFYGSAHARVWQKDGIREVNVTSDVDVSHKLAMAGPFNRGDTIINKHFTLLYFYIKIFFRLV